MAKKQTAKKSAPQKGLLEDWLKSLFKNFKPDVSKLDRAAFRAGVTQAFGAWKPTVTLPGNVDDMLIDTVADLVCDMVENATKAAGDDDGGGLVLMGMPKGGHAAVEAEALDYTKQDAVDYLAALGTSVPDECRKKIERHPEILASLKRLSKTNQIKVVNSSTLLDWLIRYGPAILSFIMKFLPFIL